MAPRRTIKEHGWLIIYGQCGGYSHSWMHLTVESSLYSSWESAASKADVQAQVERNISMTRYLIHVTSASTMSSNHVPFTDAVQMLHVILEEGKSTDSLHHKKQVTQFVCSRQFNVAFEVLHQMVLTLTNGDEQPN